MPTLSESEKTVVYLLARSVKISKNNRHVETIIWKSVDIPQFET